MDGQVDRPSERERASQTPYIDFELLAAGLNDRNFCEIRREIVGRKVFNTHLGEAHERTAEIGFRFTAAIDNHSDCGDDTTMCADDIDCFLHASATCHHVFDNDELFTRRNLKTAPQDELALVFFHKDVVFA